jgi:hypothetical protein
MLVDTLQRSLQGYEVMFGPRNPMAGRSKRVALIKLIGKTFLAIESIHIGQWLYQFVKGKQNPNDLRFVQDEHLQKLLKKTILRIDQRMEDTRAEIQNIILVNKKMENLLQTIKGFYEGFISTVQQEKISQNFMTAADLEAIFSNTQDEELQRVDPRVSFRFFYFKTVFNYF